MKFKKKIPLLLLGVALVGVMWVYITLFTSKDLTKLLLGGSITAISAILLTRILRKKIGFKLS